MANAVWRTGRSGPGGLAECFARIATGGSRARVPGATGAWARALIAPMLFGALLSTGSWCRAESLWVSGASLYTDTRAHAIGDLVTLIIVEKTQASQAANTTTAKDASVSVGPGVGLLEDVVPLVSASGKDKLTAGGTTTRGGSLQAKITTKIIDVLPNGNLTIEGRQTILLNGEAQEIVVSGIIRPEDIAADNTVLSTYVADARISYKGAGALGDKQQPGLLTRILGWLF